MKTTNHYIITLERPYMPEHIESRNISLSLRAADELKGINLPLLGSYENCLVYDLYFSNEVFTREHYKQFINFLLESYPRNIYAIIQIAYLMEVILFHESIPEIWTSISHTINESDIYIPQEIAKEIVLENNLILAEYSLIKRSTNFLLR